MIKKDRSCPRMTCPDTFNIKIQCKTQEQIYEKKNVNRVALCK